MLLELGACFISEPRSAAPSRFHTRAGCLCAPSPPARLPDGVRLYTLYTPSFHALNVFPPLCGLFEQDLVSEGMAALDQAAVAFCPEREGARFSTFAGARCGDEGGVGCNSTGCKAHACEGCKGGHAADPGEGLARSCPAQQGQHAPARPPILPTPPPTYQLAPARPCRHRGVPEHAARRAQLRPCSAPPRAHAPGDAAGAPAAPALRGA